MTADRLNKFDPVASYYDFLARLVFGRSIVRAQTRFFGEVSPGSRILILGGGTGSWLSELVDKVPGARITFVDASAAMLRIARARARASAITFIHGTEDNIPEEPYDVVMTPFILDTFDEAELPKIVDGIFLRLRPGGRWYATDFVGDSYVQRVALKCMYLFFRMTCGLACNSLPPWREVLARSMKCMQQEMYYAKFISACVFVRTR